MDSFSNSGKDEQKGFTAVFNQTRQKHEITRINKGSITACKN